MIQVDFAESCKNNQYNVYKARILETNVSAFSRRAAILTLMGKLTVMLSWSLRVRTTTELHGCGVWKRLLLKASTVNVMKICTCRVMEWGLNSGSVLFVNC